MQKQSVNRWRLVAVGLVCLMLLGALSLFQNVMAQEEPGAVPALQPPFRFQLDEQVSAAAAFPPLPVTARRLLTETFDSFTPSTSVTGTIPEWHVFTDTGSADYGYWNRVAGLLSPAYANTVWASCGTCDGDPAHGRDPDVDNYLPNQGAWMIYGPVTLTDYYAAEVTFNYRLDVRAGDSFWFGISNDGTNFVGSQVPYAGDFTTNNWLAHAFNMGTFAGSGKPAIYLGFYFQSNGDAAAGRGAFVDNVILRAASYRHTFMPVVARNFTIIPPALYNFTWDLCVGNPDPDCQNQDTDFWQWGGPAGEGNPRIWEQGYYNEGNPGYGMYVYNTRTALTTMSGPDLRIPYANYQISADFFVYKSKRDARYGLIFGADNATFGKNSQGLLTFNANTNYYKFVLAFPDVTNFGSAPTRYRLEHCNGSATNCAKVIDFQNMPGAAGADGVWDTVTVRRANNVITLLVNNYALASVSDTYGGGSEFGMFISSTSYNDAPPKNPLEIDYDNYRVDPLP